MLLGLIADTHGYAGADVIAAFYGVDHILHAGDIGEGVLEPLTRVAPVTAVRGNNDVVGEARFLPERAFVEFEGHHIAIVHRLVDEPDGEWDLLVYGHCHRQHDDDDGTRRRLNPGAAGRRGFHRQRSVALLTLEAGRRPLCQFVELGQRQIHRGIPAVAGTGR